MTYTMILLTGFIAATLSWACDRVAWWGPMTRATERMVKQDHPYRALAMIAGVVWGQSLAILAIAYVIAASALAALR